MKKQYFIALSFCLMANFTLMAQTIDITGIVKDETGELLPMVNIVLLGTSRGTVSNMEGKFNIRLTQEQLQKSSLEFSFIGYKTQVVPILNRRELLVILQEDKQVLDEVVITAIGISREKKQVGYALQDVKGEELNQSREVNVINSLNAKVAGVQVTSASGSPGASAAIRIRGSSSIGGSNEPLFIIDGIPVDNAYRGSNFTDQANRLVDLNPDDIEDITVLKGPAAAALYGINAANGAIVINTKRGKQGKTEINFSSSLIFDQVNRLPGQQKIFSQGRNGEYRGPETGTRESWGARLEDLRFDGATDYRFDRRGRLVRFDDPTATGLRAGPFNNAEEFFTTGITSNTSLGITGGSDKNLFSLSIGRLIQSGIVPLTDFNRTSIRLSGETKVNKRLTIGASANYVNSTANRGQRGSNLSGVMLGLMRAPASFDLANGFDDPVNTPEAYMFGDGTQRTYFPIHENPYWSINKNRNLEDVDRLVGFTEVKYEAADWIQFTWRLGLDQYSSRLKSYWDNNSAEFGTGRLYQENVNNRLLNSDFLVSINKSLSSKWDFSAIVGHNYRYDLEVIDEFDGYEFVLPNFYDKSNIDRENIESLDDFIFEKRLVGVFADMQFAYNNYLFFNATGRNDWTSTLAPGQFSFFYPSVSSSFVFTEAFNKVNWRKLDFGKVRVSYAMAANGAPSPYQTSNFFVLGTPSQGFLSYTPTSVLGNPNLRPEQKIAYEAGTDLRFFDNRLQLDLTWYKTLSRDQIISLPVVPSTGFSAMISNADNIEIVNQGWEGILTLRILNLEGKRNRLAYTVVGNFTRNRNYVNSTDGSEFNIALERTGLASTTSRVIDGQPYGVLFGTAWERDAEGNILVNELGYPLMTAEQQIIGDPNPRYLLGIRNRFNYKDFELSFLLDIRRGGDMFNGTAGVMRRLGTHITTENREDEIVFKGVKSDGTPNTTPIKLDESFYSRYPLAGVSEASIEEVNWFRVRDVNFTWNLPRKWTSKMKVQRASLTLTGRNLFLWTSYSGIDPETNLSGAGNAMGRDYFNNPNTRSYGVSINLNF